MANVIATNFSECNTALDFLDVSTNVGINTANYLSQMGWPNGNGRVISHSSGTASGSKNLPPQTTYHYHALHRMDGAADDGLVGFRESTTYHVHIAKDATRHLRIERGTTAVATSVGTLPNGPFHLYVGVTISDTVGIVTVKVNGADFVTFSGDTRNGLTGIIDNFYFPTGNSSGFVTDLWINDATGSVNNGYDGPVRLWAERMDTEGPSGQTATPTTGTDNSDMIDDPVGAHDSDTTYIEWTAPGADYYKLSPTAFTGAQGTIKGAGIAYLARNTDGGAHTGRAGVKKGGLEINGTDAVWGNVYQRKYDRLPLDPSTSAVWANFAALIAAEWKLETVT